MGDYKVQTGLRDLSTNKCCLPHIQCAFFLDIGLVARALVRITPSVLLDHATRIGTFGSAF